MNRVVQVPGDSYEPFRRCTGYQGLHINTHTDLYNVMWYKYLKNRTADQKRMHEREKRAFTWSDVHKKCSKVNKGEVKCREGMDRQTGK